MPDYELESDLGQFLGSYLGQDWDASFPTPWAAVEGYVASEPQDVRVVARTQLAEVLEECRSERTLSLAMDRVRMNFHPPGAGTTYRVWLEKVERYLRDHES